MIIKDITYKGFALSSETYHIIMSESNKTVSLRTDINAKQNFHWARSSSTLAEWRLFTFSWIIYGATYAERQIGVDYINNLIKPEWIPSLTNTWFYQLTWKDWNDNIYKTQAKVYKSCEFNHTVNEPTIEFSFELYSEVPYYFWFTDQIFTGASTNNTAWIILPAILPFGLSWIANTLQVTNWWDFVAPCSIEIVWTLENPVIYNNTTVTAYRLDWITTTDLVIDNRGSTLIVQDNWLDVSKYRGSWSSTVFLNPWLNEIFIFWDNASPSVVVTIEYNYTYMGS